jgi:hypothetical protein
MGVDVELVNEPPVKTRTTDTGRVFVLGRAQRGPANAFVRGNSLGQLFKRLGARLAAQPWVYDGADCFFKEKGAEVLFARVVGPAAAVATLALKNATAETTMNISAIDVGEWGNELTVQVITEGAARVFVIFLNGVEVQRSPALATKTEAVAWSQSSAYIRLVDVPAVVGLPATLAAKALASGTEDASHITKASYEAADALLDKSLGGGQQAVPGVTSPEIQEAIAQLAESKNRRLLTDPINTESVASLETAAGELRGKPGMRSVYPTAQWGIAPGLAPGTTRVVPYSMVQAGIISRNDGSESLPPVDDPAAGEKGVSLSLVDLAVHWTEAQVEQLEAAGLNPVIIDPDDGKIKAQGDSTLANPETDPAWVSFAATRLYMFCESQLRVIVKKFFREKIPPSLQPIIQAGGECQAFLEKLSRAGMLFNDPTEAIDVGPPINTPETVKAGQINVKADVEASPNAGTVTLEIAVEA